MTDFSHRFNRSQLWTAWNKARTASFKHASLEAGRVNRALGLLQSKAQRPYNTTVKSCDCYDAQRGICKHRIAVRVIEICEELFGELAEDTGPADRIEAKAPLSELDLQADPLKKSAERLANADRLIAELGY